MMKPERRRRIEELFDAALDRPPEERTAFLEEACAGDAELYNEVRALLAAHEREDGVLERDLGPVAELLESSPKRRERIGPYRVLRELGRGGMGVVYLAERDDGQFRRRVAVKVLRADDDPELHRRIIAERQILASLDHPNIARLLDGGVTDDGRPYLVMEHVNGLPIDVYCDRMRLTVAERLRLFILVARAIDYAHRNLIVHRDLKPSNILVTPTGEVKLLDFGIAKLLNPTLAGIHSPVTRTAHRVLTPAYASPEQLRGETLTTTTDVYSLGVILYELLTGHRPHPSDARSVPEMITAVFDRDPERPSTRVTRAAATTQTDGTTRKTPPAEIARARRATPERLKRQLRGDLDAITLMALRKEPARRYGSAELMAQDIERHLDGLPVTAHRGSRGYRLRKLLRRHRLEATAVALVVLSLLLGAGAATWQARIAHRERDRAEDALRQSEEVTEFLVGLFEASDPTGGARERVTARALLRRGALRVEQLSGEPTIQARMLAVLGRVHERLGLYRDADRLTQRAVAIQEAHYGGDHPELAATLLQSAYVLQRLGQYDSARAVLDRTRAMQARLFGPDHPDIATTLHRLAGVDVYRGELADAERLSREALELRRRTLGPDDPSVVASMVQVGSVLRRRGDYAGAEVMLRDALRLREAAEGPVSTRLSPVLLQLADLLHQNLGRTGEAETLYRRAVTIQRADPQADPSVTVWALGGLAAALEADGDLAGAETLLREALAIRRRTYGDVHPFVAGSLGHLAAMFRRNGRYAEAEGLLREAAEIQRQVVGESHPAYAGTLTALGSVLTQQGRLAEADSILEQATAIRVSGLGADHPLVALTLRRRAIVYSRRGEFSAADSLLQRALHIARTQTSAGSSLARRIHSTLADVYTAWGRPEEAARHRRLATGR